ncbi:hypothetical protein B6U81_00475 [Thermoplasmatales archaeon ex4484_30]|nr:MAG: hypothetical protein B6U81_00475 [Thermoplasmatales archaeon ex4484_30]
MLKEDRIMSENSTTDLFNMSKPDREKYNELVRQLAVLGIKNPSICFQCAKCTSGCEAMKLLELQPHSIMASAKSGFIDEILESDLIWACVGCYKCKERCPQEMSPVEVMFVIKNWYVSSGKSLPGDYQKILQGIITKGYIQDPLEVLDRENRSWNRDLLGLPQIKRPKDMKSFASAISQLATEKL